MDLAVPIGDVIALFSVALATAMLMFGIMKWRDTGIHARITEIKNHCQKQIDEARSNCEKQTDEIKENYAHRNEMDQSVKNVETMIRDMKQEQHRMSQRMDEFLKWLMQLQSGKIKDD